MSMQACPGCGVFYDTDIHPHEFCPWCEDQKIGKEEEDEEAKMS